MTETATFDDDTVVEDLTIPATLPIHAWQDERFRRSILSRWHGQAALAALNTGRVVIGPAVVDVAFYGHEMVGDLPLIGPSDEASAHEARLTLTYPTLPLPAALTPTTHLVAEFMQTFGQTMRLQPNADVPERDLRVDLIAEEFAEFLAAVYGLVEHTDAVRSTVQSVVDRVRDEAAAHGMPDPDVVETADALADMDVVITGAALAFGIPHTRVVAEVHRSNMSKVGEDDRPIYREDGKVLKGPGYTPPNVAEVLGLAGPVIDLGDAGSVG